MRVQSHVNFAKSESAIEPALPTAVATTVGPPQMGQVVSRGRKNGKQPDESGGGIPLQVRETNGESSILKRNHPCNHGTHDEARQGKLKTYPVAPVACVVAVCFRVEFIHYVRHKWRLD